MVHYVAVILQLYHMMLQVCLNVCHASAGLGACGLFGFLVYFV